MKNLLGLSEDREGRAGCGVEGWGLKVAAAGSLLEEEFAGRGREERNMISLIMEGKFLQIEPVKYLQLPRLLFFQGLGEGCSEAGQTGTGSGRQRSLGV